MKPIFEVGLGNDTADFYKGILHDKDSFDLVTVNPYNINIPEFMKGIQDIHDKVVFPVNSRELPNSPLTTKYYSNCMLANMKSLYEEDIDEGIEKEFEKLEECEFSIRQKYPTAGVNMSRECIDTLIRDGYSNFVVFGNNMPGDILIYELCRYIMSDDVYLRVAQSILQCRL